VQHTNFCSWIFTDYAKSMRVEVLLFFQTQSILRVNVKINFLINHSWLTASEKIENKGCHTLMTYFVPYTARRRCHLTKEVTSYLNESCFHLDVNEVLALRGCYETLIGS
jgi:hypothetical protein